MSDKKRLLIVGAGGHGKVVADAACLDGKWQEIGFVDDKYPELENVGRWSVLGKIADLEVLFSGWDDVVVAIGDNQLRLSIQREALSIGYRLAIVVHPSAVVSSDVQLGEGSVVFANAVINPGTIIGEAVIVNTAATIDHDNLIENGAHISPGVNLAGNVHVGELSWIGIGATVINDCLIGCGATVGAGAVVIDDVADNVTVVGVPAG